MNFILFLKEFQIMKVDNPIISTKVDRYKVQAIAFNITNIGVEV